MKKNKYSIPLYLLTYNCNKQKLNSETFLSKIIESLPEELSTLYVFGIEELCSIIDGCFEDNANKHLIQFNRYLIEALNQKYGTEDVKFHTIGMNHMGAIGIIAITPYPLKFHKLRVGQSGCGYGYSSMKGVVGMRLTYLPEGKYDSGKDPIELTFANAHLSAYEGEYYFQKRNKEVIRLMRSIDFGDGYSLLKPRSHCFFMGDLNYRTVKKYNPDSTGTAQLLSLQDQAKLSPDNIEELVKEYDELTDGRQNGTIFAGFSEACINFRPTYKYHINTAIFNRKRSPSWCDRILFQSTYKIDRSRTPKMETKLRNLPEIHKYDSIGSILDSDHKPVFLSITIPLAPPQPIISPSGYLQVLPSERPNSHYQHGTNVSQFDMPEESIIGSTLVYMKPTMVDRIIQNLVRRISDRSIGYGLWFSTTSRGRLTLLAVSLVFWALYYFM